MAEFGVAVIIAARNEAALIARAVTSALRQTKAAEIIVVDDGSTDETRAVAAGCDDGTGRLRIFRFDENRGPAVSRNHGIEHSTSPYVCTLDADDYLQDGRLEAALRLAGEDWDLVADDIMIAAEDDPHNVVDRIGIDAGSLSFKAFLQGNLHDGARGRVELGFLKPIMRRAFLERHGLRYDPELRLGEDFTLYAEALAHGARFKLLPACGYVAVHRAKSLSLCHEGHDLEALANSDDRLLALPTLSTFDRAILRRHRNRLLNRAYHHRMLEAKHEGDIAETLRYLLRRPASTAYILRETMRLKGAALLAAGASFLSG